MEPSQYLHSNESALRSTFTGRTLILSKLKQWGKNNSGLAVIVGSAGVGKTTLARMYGFISKSDYDQQIFIQGKMFQSVGAILPYISSQLGIQPAFENQHSSIELDQTNLLYELSEGRLSKKKILIIIDGLNEILFDDRVGELLLKISMRSSNTRWLFTTRNSRFTRLSSERVLLPLHDFRYFELSGFNQVEAQEFLAKRFQLTGFDNDKRIRNLSIHELGGNPLLLNLIGDLLVKGNNFEKILSNVSQKLVDGYTHLMLFSDEHGLNAIPVNQLLPQELITPKSIILNTAPYIQLSRLSRFWKSQLEEFEKLINNPKIRESEIQQFFERNPQFLMGIDYVNVIPHPILRKSDGAGKLIPDFFLQPIGQGFADILDLKLPSKPVIVGKKDRLHFGAAVIESVAQVREYRNYFEDPNRRQQVLNKYGLTAYRPSVSIIIGRTPIKLTEEKMKQISESIPLYTKIITYDQLFQKMDKIAQMYTL